MNDLLRYNYRAWCASRAFLAERENDEDDQPRANEWEWSDDAAVDLMHAMAAELGYVE